jgi:hypothetical protein
LPVDYNQDVLRVVFATSSGLMGYLSRRRRTMEWMFISAALVAAIGLLELMQHRAR